jgi:hypothetical protein
MRADEDEMKIWKKKTTGLETGANRMGMNEGV